MEKSLLSSYAVTIILLHAVTVKLKDSYVTFWRECIFDDDRTDLTTGNGNKLRISYF